MFVVDYIVHSRVGFYVFEVCLTTSTILRPCMCLERSPLVWHRSGINIVESLSFLTAQSDCQASGTGACRAVQHAYLSKRDGGVH
mgnify:FL=1